MLQQFLLSLGLLLLLLGTRRGVTAFAPPLQKAFQHPFGVTTSTLSSSSTSTTTRLFLFDFFKQRSQEGLDQLSNIAESARRGELGKGLSDAASYTSQTNQAFAEGLAKSRNRLLQNLEALFSGLTEDDLLEELEDILLQADLGAATAQDIIEEVKSLRGVFKDTEGASGVGGGWMLSRDDLRSILRGKLIEALSDNLPSETSKEIQFAPPNSNVPTILFIMGANGMGKTTTIGKLAHRLRTEGNQTVLLAACDTFRAGAVEQLQQWADRAGCDMIGPDEKTAKTPAAVLYKALDCAMTKRNNRPYSYDTVLVDTSGRLSNNEALTAELAKMKRVIQKRLSTGLDAETGKPTLNKDVPHETLLVLDAAQGRMALDSAKTWHKEIGLTGLILTKLDGSARGGSVVAVSRDLKLPVKLIGVGEGIDDLRDFEPERFVDSLLGIGQSGGKSYSSSKSSLSMGGGGAAGGISSGGGASTKNEGAMLAARLQELRKERDAAASKAKKKELVGASSSAMGGANMQPPPGMPDFSAGSPTMATKPQNPGRRNKSKKKKGGKK